MTQIALLPLLSYPLMIGTNEDWSDAFPFVDASGAPISGAGIVLQMMVRTTAVDLKPHVVATSDGTGFVYGLPINGTLAWGGSGGNLIVLSVPVTTCTLLTPGAYVYEIQGVGDGLRRTLVSGTLTVNLGVVR